MSAKLRGVQVTEGGAHVEDQDQAAHESNQEDSPKVTIPAKSVEYFFPGPAQM